MVDINGDGQADPVPQSSPDVFEFDPATNTVRQFSESLPKSAWGMASAAVSPTKGYLFGGFTFSVDPSKGVDASRRDWVLELDLSRTGPTERKFRELASTMPYPVQDAAAVRLGENVYVFGGLAANDNATNPCPTYTNQQNEEGHYPLCQSRNVVPFQFGNGVVRSDLMKEMPYRAQFISAVAVNGKAYVPGGILPDGSAASSILEFDPARASPVRVLTPTLPQGLFGAGVVTDGKSVFVLGGRTGSERHLTDDVVRIDVAPTLPWAPRAAGAAAIPGGLRLSWEPPAYDGDSPVSLYRVYRASLNEPEAVLKEVSTLALDDMTVKPGVAYVYRIGALNAVGESNATARVLVTAGTTPPGAVSGFQAYPGDGETVLRWSAPAELGGANLSGYRVVRDGAVVATLPPTRTDHHDAGLTNGVAYAYTIRAYNARGDGPESPTLRVSPAAVPQSPSGLVALAQEHAVSLTWEPPAGAWDRFHVYRSVVSGARGERVGTNLTATSFTDEGVEKGRTYHYQVVAVNGAGESPPSEPASASLVRTPGPPLQVQVLSLDGEMRVTWRPPTDTGDAPLESLRYYVTRSAPGAAARIVASDLRTLVHVDRTLQPGTAYTYTVTTLNPQASAPSPAVTAVAKEAVNLPPVASVNVLPPVAAKGEPVQIDASQSQDPDGAIRAYVFDFGDGSDPAQGTEASVDHVYERNGTYTVKVIVTDDRNEDAFTTARVVVGEIEGNGQPPGEDLPGNPRSPSGASNALPGSSTGGIPGPGALLALAAVCGAALASRRWRR
jgi:fibronectin type 3 domain-containing protein